VELLRKPNARRQNAPADLYRGYEHPMRTAQGFRVLWIWSSQKEALDRSAREHRIAAAEKALEALSARIGQPRSRLMTIVQVSDAVQKILREKHVEPWIKTEFRVLDEDRYTQAARGRPGPQTAYVRHIHQNVSLHWQSDAQALLDEARTDGIFPLITNDEKMSVKDVLVAYKHQPTLEKRHQQFKSVLEVRPMMLKNHLRIEAFLFLYPDERPCAAPTTERIFELFEDLRRHRLVDSKGRVHQRFYDELSEPQRVMLRLFKLSPQQYLSAAEGGAPAG
jgi:hypothetical protein